MDRGRTLSDASSVLVQVAGGPGMSLSVVEILMRELNKHIGEQTQLLFGTAVDGRMGDRLSVTLISSLPADQAEVAPPRKSRAQAPPPPRPEPEPEPLVEAPVEPQIVQFVQPEPTELPPAIEPEPAMPVFEGEEIPEPEPVAGDVLSSRDFPEQSPLVEAQIEPEVERAPQAAAPRIIPPKKKPLIAPKVEAENPKREKPAARQEVLQFEPVTRGRFEKSEPTIVEGQDLDVPTFLRKNVRVK
jgi:cell division protein FtsZ